MKTQIMKNTKQGFTLVELLVVIVIIAVLATLGFAVGNGALQRARKVTAQAAATAVANSVEQFYSEYHVLPSPDSGAPEEDNGNAPYLTNAADGRELLDVLCGFEDEQNERKQNERKIRFLNVKESEKGNRDGSFTMARVMRLSGFSIHGVSHITSSWITIMMVGLSSRQALPILMMPS